MTKQHFALFPDEMKSSLLWDEDTDAWVYIGGNPQAKEDPRSYYRIIPTLYRAIDKRAKAISNMPFALMKGEEDYDTSANWENKIGLIPSMRTLLWVIESSLTLTGQAYLKQEKNAAGYSKYIRHLDPTSVSLDQNKLKNGEIVFKRDNKEFEAKTLIYFWYPDPYVEIGPPSASPAGAALNACGVLANVDEFAKKYFARGAIKAMLFAMQGAPKEQAEMFESWWTKFVSGIGNAFRTKVINADKVTPVVVGEGIKELEDTTVTTEKREEIAAALDIPFSILFSNAANYATAQQDKRNWLDDFVIPECNFIADVLNSQLFQAMGYHFEYRPESLDIMQEDEASRATSLKTLVDAGLPLLMAMDILGYELSDEDRAELEAMENEPEPEPEPEYEPVVEEPVESPVGDQEDPGEAAQSEKMVSDMDRWKRKAHNALKRGKSADVDFESIEIPPELAQKIHVSLAGCKTPEEVTTVFTGMAGSATTTPALPVGDAIYSLVAELKRANDLLEATQE